MAKTTATAFRRTATGTGGQTSQVPAMERALITHPRAAPGLGRPARFPQGRVTGRAAGNSVVRSDVRGEAAALPGHGAGRGIADKSPYPSRVIYTPAVQLLRRARTPGYQNGRLIARDRHIMGTRGYTVSGSQPQATGGMPNPEADGPPQTQYRMLDRTVSWEIGTDATRFLDNSLPKPKTSAGGKPYPLGTQGDPWSPVYGGTPHLYRPYGSRGGAGTVGPAPRVVALPGGPYKAGTLLDAGSPQDGPQLVPGGPPWGLVSHAQTPRGNVNAVQKARMAGLRVPMVNRPLNSRRAGQSYDQTVVHLDGSQAVKPTRVKPLRQPGMNGRLR